MSPNGTQASCLRRIKRGLEARVPLDIDVKTKTSADRVPPVGDRRLQRSIVPLIPDHTDGERSIPKTGALL